MTEFIHLLGADNVQRAGSAMEEAADNMQRAAGSFEDPLFRHREFLDDWLLRLESIVKKEEI